MKLTPCLPGILFLLSTLGCGVVNMDPGPTLTANDDVETGKAESVAAEIHMGAGELHLDGGSAKLLTASYRYSERMGRPTVQYSVTDSRGRLVVESPKESSSGGKTVNEWTLHMGSDAPLEVSVHLGAGQSDLDFSKLPLKSLQVDMGAGELRLNLAGKYTKDVPVQVNAGVGEARIRLPKEMGVVVDAKAGIGGVSANGLTQRDGKYYNAAYSEGKPAIRLDVRGGVGEINLTVE